MVLCFTAAESAWGQASAQTANYPTLPADLSSPLGSGNPAQPGFKARVYQISPVSADPANIQDTVGVPNLNEVTEQELAGLWGTNTANLTGAGSDGYFVIANSINWNRDLAWPQGNFSAPNYPEDPIPGIPGTALAEEGYDDIAAEILTFVEFPTAGLYTMGVNSDDGFRVIAGEKPDRISPLLVAAPASIAGYYAAVSAGTNNGGLATPLPMQGVLAGKVVYAVPNTGNSDLVNANEIKGNIALIDRGGGATFLVKLKRAVQAGAIAAIMVNSRDVTHVNGVLPFVMSDVEWVNIPAVMITLSDGAKLKAHLDEGVYVTLADDSARRLGEYNGAHLSEDTIFTFNVPVPGVYPLRCTWEQGRGDANLEWFMVGESGQKVLLNDRSNPIGLQTFRARAAAPPRPSINLVRAGPNVVIEFTGILQSAQAVPGPYSDISNATSPYAIAEPEAARFYRARSQ